MLAVAVLVVVVTVFVVEEAGGRAVEVATGLMLVVVTGAVRLRYNTFLSPGPTLTEAVAVKLPYVAATV